MNDDDCDVENCELHHSMNDPAALGNTAHDRHGKGDYGDGVDNKKTAVECPTQLPQKHQPPRCTGSLRETGMVCVHVCWTAGGEKDSL
ncbi:hypothetical protein MRX96_051668 [Rhipicephalus microplus]